MANLTEALRIMLFGMLGVFVFMGLFYGLIHAFDRLFKVKKDE
ncbi:MAG: OadG family protein [Candidatus Cloacimonetes bacterium]|nr:OadG family protein [Candidatus Cloacimonadota bacterium]